MYPKILICNRALYSSSILKTHINRFTEAVFYEAADLEDILNKAKSDFDKGIVWDYFFVDLELKSGSPLSSLKSFIHFSPDTTIVITGGLSLTDENIAAALRLGIKHFLPKPFNADYISFLLKEKESKK